MNARPEPVDVLAVMDALVESTARLAAGGTVTADPHTVEVAKRTRAAIAKLIEAATEVDRLSRGIGDWSDEKNVERAVLRQRAALARVGGGK